MSKLNFPISEARRKNLEESIENLLPIELKKDKIYLPIWLTNYPYLEFNDNFMKGLPDEYRIKIKKLVEEL